MRGLLTLIMERCEDAPPETSRRWDRAGQRGPDPGPAPDGKAGTVTMTQGAGVVTGFLRAHFGAGNVSVERIAGDEMRWAIVQPGAGFELVATVEALRADRHRIERLLTGLVAEASVAELVPPAHYHLSAAGITIRGMAEVTFERFGQRIRCWIEERAQSEAAATAGGENRLWFVSLDGQPIGPLMQADADDVRDDVAQRALADLKARGVLRIPELPWQWSVLDAGGAEWWGRLTPHWESDGAEPAARQLVLRARATGVEKRLDWPDPVQAPDGELLRRLIDG